MAISIGVAFALSWVLGTGKKETVTERATTGTAPAFTPRSDETPDAAQQSPVIPQTAPQAAHQLTAEDSQSIYSAAALLVRSPLSGRAIALSDVNDPTFAEGILGGGAAVLPTEGKVVAPFNGKIDNVMDTKHAVCLIGDNGLELLIHVGLNTVKLNGMYYEAHVKDGDTVKAGDVLLTFDIDQIQKAGYEVVTPVVITNLDAFGDCEAFAGQEVHALDNLIAVTPHGKNGAGSPDGGKNA